MPSWKDYPTVSHKWQVWHIDDDPSEAKWFKTRFEAMCYIMVVSGYNITKEADQ